MCKNFVQLDRPQMTIWRMRSACWLPKLQTHNQNMYYLLFFHCNIGFASAPQYYVIQTLPPFFFFSFFSAISSQVTDFFHVFVITFLGFHNSPYLRYNSLNFRSHLFDQTELILKI